MLGQLWKRLGILAATLVFVAPAAAAQPPTIHRIVAVGDLHGDFAAWRAIASAAGLVDRRGRWTGGDTVLVQTGDVVDRGPDSLKIVEDLMRLQREAPRAHGRVVALVGNHEAMNVTDDLRYVSPGDYAAFVNAKSAALREQAHLANKAAIESAYRQRDPAMTSEAIEQAWLAATPLGLLEHQAAWHPDGRIGRWVIANPAVAQLDGSLFVHGGISPAYARLPLAEINRLVAAALAAGAKAPEAIINDPAGPLWYRGLVTSSGASGASADEAVPAPGAIPPLPVEEQLAQVLAAYGARRIVIGHTPILSGIAVSNDGRLVRIDTGISAVFGGKLTYLEIIDGNLVPHVVERPAQAPKGAR
jgi:hypothetical protein